MCRIFLLDALKITQNFAKRLINTPDESKKNPKKNSHFEKNFSEVKNSHKTQNLLKNMFACFKKSKNQIFFLKLHFAKTKKAQNQEWRGGAKIRLLGTMQEMNNLHCSRNPEKHFFARTVVHPY